MKFKTLIIALTFLSITTQAQNNEDVFEESFQAQETDSSVLSPEEAEQYLIDNENLRGFFPQTKWSECNDAITGNYSGFNCSNNRGISVILEEFKNRNFLYCVNEALSHVGKPQAIDLHVTHDGIQGDANHSPRSLHAEARAVDVDSFVVYYNSTSSERISFAPSTNNAFFASFRSCWGRAVNTQNGCPLISGRYDLTGSIGKEDSNHQNHMHVSIPYCINGIYSSRYFRR